MTAKSTPVAVTRTIEAPVEEVFAVLADPARHVDMDGSGMLRGTDFAGRISGVGEAFVMRMHFGPLGDYEMINHVVAFEENRRIGWEPESGNGHPDQGQPDARWGHRWTFDLRPDGPTTTTVTETWDCSTAMVDEDGTIWIPSMTRTLDRLAELCGR